MELSVPKKSLIVLCGTAGCGKSTFALKNFMPTEVVSSDRCRAVISDDESDMEVSKEAFELFYYIIKKRMGNGRLVVADSTALSYEARKKLLRLGRGNNYYTVLVAFDVPIEISLDRNNMRERKVPEEVIKRQYRSFEKSMESVDKEGFDKVVILKEEDIDNIKFIINGSCENQKDTKYNKRIILDHFMQPLTLKDDNGSKFKFSLKDVEQSIQIIQSMGIDPSWLIYIPPKVPVIYNGNMDEQIKQAFNYYKNRGLRKIIIEERKSDNSCVVIICRDKSVSEKYFSGDTIGEVYSLSNNIIDSSIKKNILFILHEDLLNARYFEKFNTDFLALQAEIIENNGVFNLNPVKILAHSHTSYISKNNLWQMENLNTLCSFSDIFVSSTRNVIKDDKIDDSLLYSIVEGGADNFVVKGAKTFPKYKDRMMFPEIQCSVKEPLREEYFNLSNFAYGISKIGLKKFIKNELSNDFFKYIIGSVVINSRLYK